MACGSVVSSSLHITNFMAVKGVLSFAPNPPLFHHLSKADAFVSLSASTKPPTKSFQGFLIFLFYFYFFWVFVIQLAVLFHELILVELSLAAIGVLH